MGNTRTKIAEALLRIKAVRLNPANPFQWASGWLSPIYCDNRQTLSYPEIRSLVRDAFVAEVGASFPDADGVAGVATAGIPHGALLADALDLPFIYVRSKAKGHGLNNQIEGVLDPAKSYVVIEDLVSTGGSSLKAVDAIRAAGGKVTGLISVFNYGFPQAAQAFAEAKVEAKSLTGLEELLQKATENNYIQAAEMETILRWKNAPQDWSPAAVNT